VRLPEYLLQKFEEESVVAGSDLGEALVYDNEIMEVQSHQVGGAPLVSRFPLYAEIQWN